MGEGQCNDDTGMEKVTRDVIRQLGVDPDTDNLFHRTSDDQYFVKNGDKYVPTCVGYGTDAEADCPTNLVCDGKLRTKVGSLKSQGRLLEQALDETDKRHHDCLVLRDCEPATGLKYKPPIRGTQYQLCKEKDSDKKCYKLNGIDTCVCNDRSEDDIEADLELAFKSFSMQTATCGNKQRQSVTFI